MKLEYDGTSPITGNNCVLEEANIQDNSVSYLCMESGFTSHENLKEGSEFQQKYEERMTELMQSCKVIDDTNKAWYPTFMQLPGGMLYAQGETAEDWHWKVAQIIPISEDEKLKYPIIGKEDEYHTSRLDVDNAKTYNKDDFENALAELYTIVKEHVHEESV
tara:strand:- start:1954 stop:2439 length:486 start_codon:yes stop_codon:yes gene_type:complete